LPKPLQKFPSFPSLVSPHCHHPIPTHCQILLRIWGDLILYKSHLYDCHDVKSIGKPWLRLIDRAASPTGQLRDFLDPLFQILQSQWSLTIVPLPSSQHSNSSHE
jgi:hypothetical protein